MKILYITTIGGTMFFFQNLIKELLEEGHTVDLACNGTLSPVPEYYSQYGCKIYQLSCTRSVFDKSNLLAMKEIKSIIADNHYDLIHCHTPIASVCTRIACRKARKHNTKIFYTAHGFHFFKGAHLKNWLIYFPVEWICAHWTDVLITINQEDYVRAKKYMKAKKVEYVPGVGIDTNKFHCNLIDVEKKRIELNLDKLDIMMLSVGELSKRKNHKEVIQAIAELSCDHIQYFICGTGDLQEELYQFALKLGIENQVHFLGFRKDISELCQTADLFVFPSKQEGLPVALMEAIACKTPVICTNIRGNEDLVKDKSCMFYPDDVDSLTECMKNKMGDLKNQKVRKMLNYSMKNSVEKNFDNLHKYEINIVNAKMKQIYGILET